MKRRLPKTKSLYLNLLLFIAAIFLVTIVIYLNKIETNRFGLFPKTKSPTPIPTIAIYTSPTPTPTPKPLTFEEMNSLYGPCVLLPTFLYHHIQSHESAVEKKQTALTVYTDIFKEQMEYLKSKGYNVVSMQDLINFFDSGTPIPPKSILLTFDDGYQDFYTDAYPILSALGFRSTMFTVTGLVNNSDYLIWDEIASMNGLALFGNHTWSHKSLPSADTSVQQKEISLADSQLTEHGLNSPKVFAYPYGGYTPFAESYIKSLGYKIAFGTVPGSVLCKKQRFNLPRLHVGDVNLSYYGF